MEKTEFSQHALRVMQIRRLSEDWVLRIISQPSARLPDPFDPDLERFYGEVKEIENRVLRVVVNTNAIPWRIVTVFPDRNMRGKV